MNSLPERAAVGNCFVRAGELRRRPKARIIQSIKMIAQGTRLGPYEIVAFIAAGEMGEVYRGY